MQQQVVGKRVNAMFGSIAGRYDLTNTVLSAGIDRLWRWQLVHALPGDRSKTVLDLCTGTGALLPSLQRRFGTVIGADFCWPMLLKGKTELGRGPLMQADALQLPYADASFDIVTVAFGVRNFERLSDGLQEIHRVLKPGGTLLVLEFGQPRGALFGALFRFYSRWCMPVIGGIVTGNRAAYEYLPATSSQFPCREAFVEILSRAGFSAPSWKGLTFGIAYIYRCTRS